MWWENEKYLLIWGCGLGKVFVISCAQALLRIIVTLLKRAGSALWWIKTWAYEAGKLHSAPGLVSTWEHGPEHNPVLL